MRREEQSGKVEGNVDEEWGCRSQKLLGLGEEGEGRARGARGSRTPAPRRGCEGAVGHVGSVSECLLVMREFVHRRERCVGCELDCWPFPFG
jgi:hypothetical protein